MNMAPLISDAALNATGVRLPVLALMVCVPAAGPRVRCVFAIPAAFVVLVAGDLLPPPAVIVQVTVAPGNPAPF
jgi:hypothetical protein